APRLSRRRPGDLRQRGRGPGRLPSITRREQPGGIVAGGLDTPHAPRPPTPARSRGRDHQGTFRARPAARLKSPSPPWPVHRPAESSPVESLRIRAAARHQNAPSCPSQSFSAGRRRFPPPSTLGLRPGDVVAGDAGLAPDGSGFRGITFSYDVRSKDRVDAVLAEAKRAGGTIAKPAQDAAWGGYFGYFTDPDGYLWKVGWAPATTEQPSAAE